MTTKDELAEEVKEIESWTKLPPLWANSPEALPRWKEIRDRVKYHIDKGAPRTLVVDEMQYENEDYTPTVTNYVINRLVETGKLTELLHTSSGYKAGFLVVTDWSPGTARLFREATLQHSHPKESDGSRG